VLLIFQWPTTAPLAAASSVWIRTQPQQPSSTPVAATGRRRHALMGEGEDYLLDIDEHLGHKRTEAAAALSPPLLMRRRDTSNTKPHQTNPPKS